MNIKATILLMAVIGSSAMGMNKRKAEDQYQGSNKKGTVAPAQQQVHNQQAPLQQNQLPGGSSSISDMEKTMKVADFFKNTPKGQAVFLNLQANSPKITIEEAAQILKGNIALWS